MWFFIGWYADNWFKGQLVNQEHINCTVAQMKEAAEGHFTTEALQWNQDKSPTISGKVIKRQKIVQKRPICSRNKANFNQSMLRENCCSYVVIHGVFLFI